MGGFRISNQTLIPVWLHSNIELRFSLNEVPWQLKKLLVYGYTGKYVLEWSSYKPYGDHSKSEVVNASVIAVPR